MPERGVLITAVAENLILTAGHRKWSQYLLPASRSDRGSQLFGPVRNGDFANSLSTVTFSPLNYRYLGRDSLGSYRRAWCVP